MNPNVPEGINEVCVRLLAKDPNERYPDAATFIEDLERVRDDLDAIVVDMKPTVPLQGVRDDTEPTNVLTGQTLSLVDRLAELYGQARRLHRAQEWQVVLDVFDQIHRLDPE